MNVRFLYGKKKNSKNQTKVLFIDNAKSDLLNGYTFKKIKLTMYSINTRTFPQKIMIRFYFLVSFYCYIFIG